MERLPQCRPLPAGFVFKEETGGQDSLPVSRLSREEIEELAKSGDLRAPFAANVCEISVKAGQEVQAGDRLLVLEAMKMQTPLLSETPGKVVSVFVELGMAVQAGDRLVKLSGGA